MYRIFTKSIFSLFLILLILLNLIFFFDFTQLFTAQGQFVSYHDKFFGFSTLYNFFTSGFTDNVNFLTALRTLLDRWILYIQDSLYGWWIDFGNRGGITDLATFFIAFGFFINSILAVIQYFFYIILYAVYVFSVVVWVFLKFVALMSGLYFNYVPVSPYDNLPPVL